MLRLIAEFLRAASRSSRHIRAFLTLSVAVLSALAVLTFPAKAICTPEAALSDMLIGVEEDGVLRLQSGLRLRLAHLLWPDRSEVVARLALAERIREAANGQALLWRVISSPDRWGVSAAEVFLNEPGSSQPPFLLQSGLVDHGIVPIWPDHQKSACWDILRQDEAAARKASRGLWANPEAAKVLGFPPDGVESMAGRRHVLRVSIRSVRPWRALHFINTGNPPERGMQQNGAPSFSMTGTLVSTFTRAGNAPAQWAGRRAMIRFVIPVGGLRRARLETPGHIEFEP